MNTPSVTELGMVAATLAKDSTLTPEQLADKAMAILKACDVVIKRETETPEKQAGNAIVPLEKLLVAAFRPGMRLKQRNRLFREFCNWWLGHAQRLREKGPIPHNHPMYATTGEMIAWWFKQIEKDGVPSQHFALLLSSIGAWAQARKSENKAKSGREKARIDKFFKDAKLAGVDPKRSM